MIDPVVRDLDRHLAEVDKQDDIDLRAEELREQEECAELEWDELRRIAEQDLRDMAEDAAAEAAIEARSEAAYDDFNYRGG